MGGLGTSTKCCLLLKLHTYLIKAKQSWFPFTILTNPVALKLNYCWYKLLPFLVFNFLAAPSHVT